MAPLAWSSIAGPDQCPPLVHSAVALVLLTRPVPAAGVLDGFQRPADLEHRGVDLAAAEEPLGLAQEVRDAPAWLVVVGKRDHHLRAERTAEPRELLPPPALGDGDVLGDLGSAGKARGRLRQEPTHLKLQAQALATALPAGPHPLPALPRDP